MYQKNHLKSYFDLVKKEKDPATRIEKVMGKSISEVQADYVEWLRTSQYAADLNVVPKTVVCYSMPCSNNMQLYYNKKLMRWSFIKP
jgi:hypothetical protein